MSPEAHQQKDVCAKADIWSLGCTVIEMNNGHGPVWFNMNRYQLFVYISGKKFDPKIPDNLGEHAQDFLTLCLMQKPEHRADAPALLKHAFIVDKQNELKVADSLLRVSDSSFMSGFPNMTRHQSADESGDFENGRVLFDHLPNNYKPEADNENRFNSLSRKSSGLSLCEQNKQRCPAGLQDVKQVVQIKSQAVKQKHLKWLATEKARPRRRSVGDGLPESATEFLSHQKTICITSGIAQSQDKVQKLLQAMDKKVDTEIECDFESD